MNPNQKSAVTFIVNYGFSSKMRYCLMIYYLLFRMQQVRRKRWQVNKMFLNRGRVTCWCWRYTVSVTAHSQQWLDWWRHFQFCREKGARMGRSHTNSTTASSVSTVKHQVAPCYNTDMCPAKLVRTKKSVNCQSLCNLYVLMHVVHLELYCIVLYSNACVFKSWVLFYFILF